MKTSRKPKAKANPKKPKIDIFEQMTSRILEMMEKDHIAPWHKPWSGCIPTNLATRKPYRGINFFTLGFSPYKSHYWLTFKQAKELAVAKALSEGRKIKKIAMRKDGSPCAPYYWDEENNAPFFEGIKKGEKKYGYIVFWKRKEVKEEEEKEQKSYYSILQYTPIFNAEQAIGIEIPEVKKSKNSTIQDCEELLKKYKHGPKVVQGGNRACYSPERDLIQVPSVQDFDSPQDYYNVLFHEHVHGTGHEKRLARKSLMDKTYFGSHTYSEEELVAEMGASFLSAHCEISSAPMVENSAAYLKHWVEKMREDKRILVQAATRAQKAFDYICGIEYAEKITHD